MHGRNPKASSGLKAETEVPAEPVGGGTSYRHDVVSVTCPYLSSFLSCADGAREMKVHQNQIPLICNFKDSRVWLLSSLGIISFMGVFPLSSLYCIKDTWAQTLR